MATVADAPELKVPKEITDKGWAVPLFYVGTDVYANPGGETRGTNEAMIDLKKSINSNGQLHPVCAAVSEDGERLDVYCGFRRTEVIRQLALEKIIRLYNKTKELKSDSDGFIPLNSPEKRAIIASDDSEIPGTDGDTWKNAFERALKERKIIVSIGTVEDKADAALKNLTENTAREDFTLSQLVNRILELLNEGVKQKVIAKGLGTSESKVSLMIKIGKLPGHLLELFSDKESGIPSLGLSEEKEKELSEQMIAAVNELKRRYALPKGNKCMVEYSHAREFVNLVITKKAPMPLIAVIDSLKRLVRMDDKGKIDEDKETLNYGVFIAAMSDAIKRAKLVDERDKEDVDDGKKEDGKEEGEEEGKESERESSADAVEPLTVDDIAAGQEASAEADAKEANAAESDKEPEAIDTAGAESDSALDSLAGPSDEDMEGVPTGSETDGDGEVDDTPAGQTKTRTIDAPSEEGFTVKDPQKTLAQAKEYLTYAAETDGTSISDRAVFLFAALELYDVIGLKEESNRINGFYTQYIEDLNAYIEALQDFAKKHCDDKAAIKELAAKRPKAVDVNIVKADAEEESKKEDDEGK